MQLQRQQLFLIGGVGLGLLAVFMIIMYLNQQSKIAKEQAKQQYEAILKNSTPVLIAKKDIPAGTAINAEDLAPANVPNKYVQPQAVTSMDRISGMLTVAPISKGEQISLSKLSFTPQRTKGLADVTPVGKRAITIPVDNISSLAGMLKPGDYVDILAMIPIPVQTADGKQSAQLVVAPLFQNVQVLAVGRETGAPVKSADRYGYEEKKEVTPLVTIALGPKETNLIAYVQEQSKIRLVLRSPADSKVESMTPTTLDSLLQYILPPPPPKPEVVPVKEPPKEYVEIYRGLSKEKIELSK